MCRIAGIIDKSKKPAQLAKDVRGMCDRMQHGGPDDEGFYTDETNGVVFGHRRLALIDLSPTGHQPMFYDDNHLAITFNGEIYNFIELKEALKALGMHFNSESDTEVILACYKAWGVESFDKLHGMFAFALHDLLTHKTYLVRDKSGIKPLYYSTINNSLTFASEVKAFEKLSYPYTENPDWKIYFLAFGHIPEPFTTYTEINSLPKAHYLSWNHNDQSFDIQYYKHNKKEDKIIGRQESADQIYTVLKNAVQKHLISDAPIGVFLSGGIDSSIITLLADQLQSAKNAPKINTLSLNFDEDQFSERYYQSLIVNQADTKHSDFTVDKLLFSKLFPKALAAMDQPSTDGVNAWFVNHFAKDRGLKAVLSGIGADELFGGYPSFKRMKFVNLLEKIPNAILKMGKWIQKPIFKRAYYLSYHNTIGKYLFLRGIFTPEEISQLLNLPIAKVDQVLMNINVSSPDHLKPEEEASWLEVNFYMQNQLLKDTDTMSMQHGVEVRVPFLDEDLIALAGRIKNEIKFSGKQPKQLLIDSFKALLPKAIWARPKMGFTFPFQKWLQKESCLDNIQTSNKMANELIADFRNGETHWSKALAVYLLFNQNPLS
ncbi:MAG: asparagine synthase (glutamine-hydrolyzing) [Pedobacter sp.]|nr:MAG: asparagine synthase (glutamine-hydrolyzing) [Pedobacter sp.]